MEIRIKMTEYHEHEERELFHSSMPHDSENEPLMAYNDN